MAAMGRRGFLRASALAGAGLGLQILTPRWARGDWGGLGAGEALTGGPFKTLLICPYGGVNPWQTFWVTPDSAQQYGWTGAGADAAALQAASCPADDGTLVFGTDALGNPIRLGPATAPLWKNKLLGRMRLITLKAYEDPHSIALARAIGARRFGTPRFAGLGAAIERRMQEEQPRALPYTYTLFSNQIGRFRYLERYASARGQHPRFVGPLPVALGSTTFSSKLPRAHATPELDALLDTYRSEFRDRMRWQGEGDPLRSKGFAAYDVAADALSLSPQLVPILTSQALATSAGPECFDELGSQLYDNATAASIALAADLFDNHGAQHVTILDSGLYDAPSGADAPYDVHAEREGVAPFALTTANLFNLLRNLVDHLDFSAGGGGPGAIGGGGPRIRLDDTLIIVMSEFGRTTGSGLAHHLGGMAAVLLGGPIQTPGISGGLDEDDAPAEYAYSHADVHAAALLASHIDPLAEGNLLSSELSAPVGTGDVIGNLRDQILAV
jgi:hypothetical protein